MSTATPISPISKAAQVNLVQSIPSNQIIALYKKMTDLDVSYLFKDVQEVRLYECVDSKYRFFAPTSIQGDPAFYQGLAKFQWYYIKNRWEFSETIKHIENKGNILEIGAGEGNFLKKGITERPNASWHGVDISTPNETIFKSIEELTKQVPIKFDVVCLFQTLEHLSDPLKSLTQMCDLLKSGGKLIISVPNNNSFIQHAKNDFLNMPPHHMGLWASESLLNLQNFLPIKIDRIIQSPLTREHESWFLKTQLKKIFGKTVGKIFSKLLIGIRAQYLLRPFSKNIIGHTVLAIFHKS